MGHPACRKGGQMDPFLDLDQLFDTSNGGMIEIVQLPDIFLDHPTVNVIVSTTLLISYTTTTHAFLKESNDEISDVDTREFMAKKINYD